MLGFSRANHKPVAEHEAEGDNERTYHEIRQILRITGINLNFRMWAGQERFLPVLWNAIAPNLETVAFEQSADRLRAEGVRAAESLGKLDVVSRVRLGESQAYQLKASLDLYHYINPKLLLLTSAVRLVLEGEAIGTGRRADWGTGLDRIEVGAPASMPPMELVAEDPDERRIRDVFDDIRRAFSIQYVNNEYRTLALWPEYLAAAWERQKPILKRERFVTLCDDLLDKSRALARALPHPVPMTRARIAETGVDFDEIVRITNTAERVLPQLILCDAMLLLDFRGPEELSRSPFPAEVRRSFEQVQGGVS